MIHDILFVKHTKPFTTEILNNIVWSYLYQWSDLCSQDYVWQINFIGKCCTHSPILVYWLHNLQENSQLNLVWVENIFVIVQAVVNVLLQCIWKTFSTWYFIYPYLRFCPPFFVRCWHYWQKIGKAQAEMFDLI